MEQKNCHSNETSYNTNLLNKEVKRLVKLVKVNDKKAMERLGQIYEGLIETIARKCSKWSKFSIYDLQQEGWLALVYCTKTFDETFGEDFSSYASVCIERSMKDFVYKYRYIIPIPKNRQIEMKNIRKAIESYEDSINLHASECELEEYLSVTAGDIREMRRDSQICSTISIEDSNQMDSEIWGIVDTENLTALEQMERESDKQTIHSAVNMLKEKERYIVEQHYGFDGFYERSFKTISENINNTVEAVSKNHDTSLKKLKNIIEDSGYSLCAA